VKTCGCSVKNLYMKRHEDFFCGARSSLQPLDEPALAFRIARRRRASARSSTSPVRRLVPNPVHRFDESIAGHPYSIEVAQVSQDRWRANIVRLPGVPTALMPFYGRTPDEAARLLTDWLSRAHRRAASPSPG
jgi:hypothetical protein